MAGAYGGNLALRTHVPTVNNPPVRTRNSGFTLLELVLAMALLAIIVGMVFGTARTSLALGNTIVKSQNEEMLLRSRDNTDDSSSAEKLGDRFPCFCFSSHGVCCDYRIINHLFAYRKGMVIHNFSRQTGCLNSLH